MKNSIFFLVFISTAVFPATYFSHLSNAWYPAKPKQLKRKLEYLEQESSNNFSVDLNPHKIRAILVPHASYDYSGVVASSVYKALEHGKFKRIFIIGPTHYIPFAGVALPDIKYEKFGNEVGRISLDLSILKKFRADSSGLFKVVPRAYDLEHSIEIQIPLIQMYCPACSIIPLMVGSLDKKQFEYLITVLRSYVDDQTLFVFTSDLTHFGEVFSYVPFVHDISKNLVALDQRIVTAIEHFDIAEFENVLHTTQATVCGAVPIRLLMTLFQKSDLKSYVVSYERSTHEKKPNHSVSYIGMIFSSQKKSDLALANQLTGYEKMVLKQIAQEALQNLSNPTASCSCDYIVTDTLRDHLAAFVTLYDKKHQLRGCVGNLNADKPLYEMVCAMTRAAALHDSRFTPVDSAEVAGLTFEISVLMPAEKIDSYQRIKVGVDGIILKYKNKSAVFLPQVPLEQGWDLETTLQQLSLKAGLGKQDYKKKDVTFEIFQTIKIG